MRPPKVSRCLRPLEHKAMNEVLCKTTKHVVPPPRDCRAEVPQRQRAALPLRLGYHPRARRPNHASSASPGSRQPSASRECMRRCKRSRACPVVDLHARRTGMRRATPGSWPAAKKRPKSLATPEASRRRRIRGYHVPEDGMFPLLATVARTGDPPEHVGQNQPQLHSNELRTLARAVC